MYGNARDFDHQMVANAVIGRNWAFLFGFGCFLFACAALAILYVVLNRPPPETPYVFYNEKEGNIATYFGTEAKRVMTDDERLIAGYMNRFVTACETWDYTDQETRRHAVKLFSTPEVNAECGKYVDATDQKSLVNTLGVKGRRRVEVVNVSILNKETRAVRFTVYDGKRGIADDKEMAQRYVAIVRFRFTKAPTKFEDLRINELGFQATSYRRDQEALEAKNN